jgi:hypothetical protein
MYKKKQISNRVFGYIGVLEQEDVLKKREYEEKNVLDENENRSAEILELERLGQY